MQTFQFTPLREGRQEESDGNASNPRFQFTPLREGRQKHLKNFFAYYLISIHAPPRGATVEVLAVLVCTNISIHAPPRGATRHCSSEIFFISFQFTPLREGRRAFCPAAPAIGHFNSRPSARGDPPERPGGRAVSHFNSRPSARGDTNQGYMMEEFVISIHAPPRGATAKDMQFLQIFCSTLTNQHGLTIVPRNLSRLSW